MAEARQVDVCLVLPPFSSVHLPSFALGILKGLLIREGISCSVDYANMYFHRAIGRKAYETLLRDERGGLIGEYAFNEAAGIDNRFTRDDYIADILSLEDKPIAARYYEDMLEHASRAACEWADACADRILAHNPKLIGCSAIYQQLNASLAVLRRVKERRSDIATFMGGYEVFGNAGVAVLRRFPFVDHIFTGESDDVFVPFVKGVLEGDCGNLPCGVVRNAQPYPDAVAIHAIDDMACAGFPDYDDFYAMMTTPEGIYAQSGNLCDTLHLEGSRGCRWGAMHPCAFCGENNESRTYRKKSPEKLLSEVRELIERYNPPKIFFSDNLMPDEWFNEVLPELERICGRTTFFTDVRATLDDAQVALLKRAGFESLQPGIESLSDKLLRLMGKGVNATHNIAFLKHCKRHQVAPLWNMLIDVPGETAQDYAEQTQLIEKIEHLHPPSTVAGIFIPRCSLYATNPQLFDLKLRPLDAFAYISPDEADEDVLIDADGAKRTRYADEVAFRYQRVGEVTDVDIAFEKLRLRKAVKVWRERFSTDGDFVRLDFYDEAGTLHITDTRGIAALRKSELAGIERAACLAAATPTSRRQMLEALAAYDEAAIEDALSRLCDKGFMLCIDRHYLTLAVETDKALSFELDFREFFARAADYPEALTQLRKTACTHDGKALAKIALQYGYEFDSETASTVNLFSDIGAVG